MIRRATAVANPNIALSKYWGKRAGPGNFPAVPSLSLTLDGLSTKTTVEFLDSARTEDADELLLNGALTAGEPLTRVSALLDRVRNAAGFRLAARVVTTNDFPTASGLASSASGFAALAVAATRAAGLDWAASEISDLARRSSASAARSVFGGLVELEAGAIAPNEGAALAARTLVAPAALDLRVVVCVTTEDAKPHGSTDAMRQTAERSPFYGAWLAEAARIHSALTTAALAGDWTTVGALAERSALAMHGCAMAAGFTYFRDATTRAIDRCRALRDGGAAVFFTVDAGPHLKAFTSAVEADRIAYELGRVPGVLRTIMCTAGEGARLVADAPHADDAPTSIATGAR